MIEIINEFAQEQEEEDFGSKEFNFESEDTEVMEEDNDEGDPDALGTLVFEGEKLSDAPHFFVEKEVEQSTTEEEKAEESAKEEGNNEDTTGNAVPEFKVPPFMSFHDTMRMWIEILAKTDEDIAKNIKKENKSFKECADYILNYVSSHRGGLNSVVTTSDALLPLVKHYYEDDNCKAETTPKNVVASASATPTKLQNALDKAADKINKNKKMSAKQKKEEQKKKEHEEKIAIGASLELPNTTKSKAKVFSGLKKGSAEYNKALESQVQLSLF